MAYNQANGYNVSVAGGVSVTVSESFSGFTENINAGVAGAINVSVTELFSGFSESINVSALEPGAIGVSITEVYVGFSELISVKLPIDITINPSNIIRVKRKNNIIRVGR